MMNISFQNKIVLITGASSGIGRALALAFNKLGAIVIGTSRKQIELVKFKNEFSNPENFYAVELDLEKSEHFTAIVQGLISKFGKIDVLINNGGLSQRSNARDTSLEIDRKIMEINYFGNIALTKAVLPSMQKNKSGQIIVISSIAGKFGFYLRSAYSASKHALHGFYESLRMEEEENGINVLIVCPGKIATKQTQDGVSAEYCAQEIVKGLLAKKEEIFIGGKEIKSVKVKRLFPKLFGKIIRKQPRE
jgi:dehydrogenase/reductase SDR family protein 7B